ncbi:MAG: hypothetical protein R2766_09615 [Saprospiraceae bacterium]
MVTRKKNVGVYQGKVWKISLTLQTRTRGIEENLYLQRQKIFILDKDKKILIKDIPAEELERIMDEIISTKTKK